jgi:uncharacterized 2Fe-2S/4Fe-4S cluster protein (DUF4445 family)
VESDYEAKGNARRPLREGRRLGCAATVLADAVIDVPSESQVHKQVVRKSVDLTGLVIDPQFTLYNVDVPKAVLGESESLSELIGAAVLRIHGAELRTWSTMVLRAVHKTAVNDHGSVTIAVDRDRDVVAIWPGFVDNALGVAIDVGSTTVAGHLCDLSTGEVLATAGVMNPQIRFGEDLMSRVSYVMMNPGGDKELTLCIRMALNDLINELLREADAPADELLDIVIVGNPIMHHIVLGIDPTPLGQAPFTLASADPVRTSAPTPPRRCWPKDRTAAKRGSYWSTSAPTQRSSWVAPIDSSLRPARPGLHSRAPRSPAASGPRPGQWSEFASTAPRSPHASRSSGATCGATTPPSPTPLSTWRSAACAVRESSR